jgi:O-antigen ligase
MWIFFLGAVFMHYYLSSYLKMKRITYYFICLIIISGTIVILQNLGLIPFLWSSVYKVGYHGFLSGTFGPNKIVLGMSMVISIGFLIGILFSKRIRISKLLVIVGVIICLIALLYSGSRTSYVGLAVFLIYFLFTNTSKFIFFSVIGGFLGVLVLLISPKVVDGIIDVIENRIVDDISEPEEIDSVDDVANLYKDLGAGRDQLSLNYIKFLLNNPLLLPFGQGFNNRSGIGYSAHNMYLTMIAELGLIGFILYFRWLLSYLIINKGKKPNLQLAVNGIVLSMVVTLLFGEHLYVYRPLFGLLGLFLITFVILLHPLRKIHKNET